VLASITETQGGLGSISSIFSVAGQNPFPQPSTMVNTSCWMIRDGAFRSPPFS
jgi:hypothetical protein